MTVAYHAPSKALLLKTTDPLALRDMIPGSRVLPAGEYTIAVRHTDTATRVLRNLGVDVEMPGVVNYAWPGRFKPMAHQRTMVDFYLRHKRCFNLSEMGVGKSAASLWAADILLGRNIIDRVVIIAPLSTLERVWDQEVFDVLPHRQASIIHGSAARREKAMQANVSFYVVNHDGLIHRAVRDFIRSGDRADGERTLVIVDEGSLFRNHNTVRWEALRSVTKRCRLWWLTGTPTPNEPTDAWAQATIVSPARIPDSYFKFRMRTMQEVSKHRWVPRRESETLVHEVMQPAIRFAKKDCIDLPTMTFVDRTAPLTKEQIAAAKEMKNQMVMAKKNGSIITAVNAADKINKMRQILGGSIRDSDEDGSNPTYVELPHAPRTELTIDMIRSARGKAIVVAPFIGMMRALKRDIEASGFSVGLLNGHVSHSARNKIIRAFKETDTPNVLVCHPQVMAHGLNLTEADVLIFYAPIYSNDQYMQVIERINRAGQTNPMTVVRIGAHPLEWGIYATVDTRRRGQDAVLELYQCAIDAPL